MVLNETPDYIRHDQWPIGGCLILQELWSTVDEVLSSEKAKLPSGRLTLLRVLWDNKGHLALASSILALVVGQALIGACGGMLAV